MVPGRMAYWWLVAPFASLTEVIRPDADIITRSSRASTLSRHNTRLRVAERDSVVLRNQPNSPDIAAPGRLCGEGRDRRFVKITPSPAKPLYLYKRHRRADVTGSARHFCGMC